MNSCSNCGKSVGLNSSSNQNQCMCGTVGGASIDGLGDPLNESFHIQEAENVSPVCTSPPDGNCIGHSGKTTTVLEAPESKSTSVEVQKRLCKSESFPASKPPPWSAPLDEEEDGVSELLADGCTNCSSIVYARSISLPTPLKPVSAMKGSREKQGSEPKKLTVTWAPDVYDPPPTSLSHAVKGKSQKRAKKNKRNGKNKQKGKGSAAGGRSGKGKKQIWDLPSHACFESACFETADSCFEAADPCFQPPYASDSLLEAADSESNCGSSFLRSLGEVRRSVAEAS